MHPPSSYLHWKNHAKIYGLNNTYSGKHYGKGMQALIQYCVDSTGATTSSTDWVTPITMTGMLHPAMNIVSTPSLYAYTDMGTGDEWYGADNTPEHLYTTRGGYKIRIKRDGTFEIIAPDNAVVDDLVAHLPKGARLLDREGRVITFDQPGNVVSLEEFRNRNGHFIDLSDPSVKLKDSLAFQHFGKIAIPNTGCHLVLPNEVRVKIDGATGAITIDDADRKVFYEAAPRGFNKFLNASDCLEDFIRYLGRLDVRQRHVMGMPLGLFINWLIIEAAEADGATADDMKPKLLDGVATLKAQPRCLFCKRFIAQARHDRGINFCSSGHMDRYLAREDLVQLPPRRKARVPVVLPPSATYFDRAA